MKGKYGKARSIRFTELKTGFKKEFDKLIAEDLESANGNLVEISRDELEEEYRKHWKWAIDDRGCLVGIPESNGHGFAMEWVAKEKLWCFLAEYELSCGIEMSERAEEENDRLAGKVNGKYPSFRRTK